MKLFLLASALILALGCYRKQKAPETKRHYWFVGYQAYKSKDYFRAGGFIQWGDSIISLDKTKQLIQQHINCSGASFETVEIVILSFCELPDSVSAFKLLGSDTAAWSYCEEPQEKPIQYQKRKDGSNVGRTMRNGVWDSVTTIKVPQSKDGNYYWGDTSGLRPRPNPIPSDTTIKPRYEYYYKLMIHVNKFGPPLDTINMVLDKLGKTLTVDQADELRAIAVRQLNNFIGRPTVDSVKIELPKK